LVEVEVVLHAAAFQGREDGVVAAFLGGLVGVLAALSDGFDDLVDLGLGRLPEVVVVVRPDFFAGVADLGGEAEVADV
jgi:hypothetical protein